jgi:hypothetical protein
VKLLRELERRLESLFDGMAGRVFGGPLHPSELAARIVRHLDLEIDESKLAPNVVEVRLSQQDFAGASADEIAEVVAQFCEDAAFERGWRLEGPSKVELVEAEHLEPGSVAIATSVDPGTRTPWAHLTGESTIPLVTNRSVVGRGESTDVTLGDDRVSRHHALIWREGGKTLVVDLGSANGTTVDGSPVGSHPATVSEGSVLVFGPLSFRYHSIDA